MGSHQTPTSSRRFQASCIGPDLGRHVAPSTYISRLDAEHWLASERRLIDRDEWEPPKQRTAALRAQSITLGEYATQWIEQRTLKPRSRSLYESLLRLHIEPTIGKVPLRYLNGESVRAWYAKLDRHDRTHEAIRRDLAPTSGVDPWVRPHRNGWRP